ncbi:MAG TPA: amino acid adenylation domain-containing protein, partial [Thermoanaerobaculia bacterium]
MIGRDTTGGLDLVIPAGEGLAGESTVSALSHGQRSLWFLHYFAPVGGAYNIAAAARVRSPLDADALERALQALVDRHPALRTTFPAAGGDPYQRIAAGQEVVLARADVTGWSAAEVRAYLAAEAWRPFDLERGPLLRVTLLTGDAAGPVVLLVIHHIVADFWSLAIVMRELPALYRETVGEAAGEGPAAPPPPGLAYEEHVRLEQEALAGERGEALLAYWRQELEGLPALELPLDRPRPAVQTYRGDVSRLRLPGGLAAALRALGRERHGTLFMVLAAAFQAFLGRHSGQDDLAIGSPRSGRPHSGSAGTVGYFVNPVVLRADLSGDPAFTELLERTRVRVLAAFEHGEAPLPFLVERLQPARDASRTPLFQVSFVMQKETRGAEGLTAFALGEEGVAIGPEGFRLESLSLDHPPAPFDLMLHAVERQGGLSLALQHNADLFDAATAARLLERFAVLLGAVAASPRLALSELPLLAAAERHQLLVEWSGAGAPAAAPGEPEATLHGLFEEQAARTPDAVALVAGLTGARWTYGELDRWAGELAHRLAAAGLRPEARVAVCLPRAPLLVASLLAVLKAGGVYVPLDPDYPRERLAFMLEDAGAAVLLTAPELAAELPEHGARTLLVEAPAGRPAAPARPLASGVLPGNLAYLIYTSGSTGRPKAVAIEHRNAVAFARWARAVFAPEEFAGVLAATSVSFDLSVFEIFVTLAWGGKVVLAANALELPRLAAAGEVALVNTVPSAMAELVRQGAVPASVRTVNLAGEPLKRSLADAIHEAAVPGREVRLLDLYGPSESTTYSTWAPVPRDERREPSIGRPIAGTRAALLGRSGEPVPIGVPGELYLGGEGLARGYLGRPDLTAERFVPDLRGAESGEPGGRLYATGDLARYLPDGRLEYLGRIDQQVKVRGFRIELGEVEAALLAHDQVREAAVLAREDLGLVAYVAAAGEEPSGLRDFLARRLPGFMLPSAYVLLPALPLTANGKVDRKALAGIRPQRPAAGAVESGAGRTPTEELLAGIFTEVLGVEGVGLEESFFALGGHSLAAMRLQARVRETLGAELPLSRIFETPTVASLARAVRALEGAGRGPLPPLAPVPRTAPPPLSFAQQRLWFLHQLEPASPVYNVPAAIGLRGPLSPAALAAALSEVARRHEALRTRFAAGPDGPVQDVAPPAPVPLPAIDLTALPRERRPAEARRLARAEALAPFDLGRGPLLRARLVRLAGEESLLLLTLHHAVSDGWSLRLLAAELGALYEAGAAGRPSPLPELPVQYGDYAVWQRSWLRGERLEAEIAHWRARLAGAPPVLDLPLDRPRPPVMSDRGAARPVALDADLLPRLRELARRQGVTLFMAGLAAFQALLARITHADDVSVGTPVAGRGQVRTEGLIGFFVNTLVMRTDLSGDPTFAALLARVREVALAAYAHQDLPFEKLVEELQPRRDLSYSPLFQVLFTLEGEGRPSLRLGAVEADLWPTAEETAKLDLALALETGAAGLSGELAFRSDLFEGATIERLAGHFARLLAGAVEEPGRRLAELPLLSAAERDQLLVGFNDTGATSGPEVCLHQLFEAQAARAPERVALVAPEGARLTYRELNERAERLARRLRGLGLGPEVLAAVLLERSADLIVTLLAIHKAGGA